MKTLILTAALAVSAALASAQKPASENNDSVELKKSTVEVAVLQHTGDEVTLLMEKAPRELVRIMVYEGKDLLYVQRVKKEATANITYDISQFPDGNYTLKVVKDKEVVYAADIKKGPEVLAENK